MPRFVSLPESIDPTSVLSRLRVACVGVGAVGRNSALHLARLGAGTFWICDRSRYKPESLLTQPIDPDEIGRPKAEAVGRAAKRLSPASRVYVHDGPFESLGPLAFADADVVLLATDNIRAEVECGQRCLRLGKALFHTALHGGTLTAQVRVYRHASAEGPCPACALGRQERAALTDEVIYSCDGSASRLATNPTMSTPHLCALAGALAVNQVLRYAIGLGTSVADEEIEWNGFTMRTRRAPLVRNPECPADHVVWSTRHAAGRPVGDHTLREIAQAAGIHDIERAAFRLGETSFVERGICRAGHGQAVERFVGPGKPAGTCATCGGAVLAEPFFERVSAPSRVLLTKLDRPVRELCSEPPDFVLASENGRAVLFRSAPQRERAGGDP